MRTMFRILAICCLIGLSVGVPAANAQQDIVGGPRGGGRSSLRLLDAGRGLMTPSRIWFEANLADNGLGYEGPYVTLGSKTHFADDFLDGRWLAEGQANLSLHSGGFFANFGLQRVFTLKNPGADIVVGGFIDYDGDDSGNFGHKFWQVSANAAIKTERWDLIANGYLPFGTTDYAVGTPGAEPQFVGNNLVLRAGLDSALRGFDMTLRTRPTRFANVNGHVDFGTYGFESDTVNFFFGARARVGAQLWKGWQTSVELNYDDRFDFTGALQLAYVWGTGERGTAGGLGNDLERTLRSDHIVRFRRDAVFAIDPDTGRAFNIVHVDNSATANGNGTFESRFDSLADAEAASGTDDIIFVHQGDGTSNNYDTGIVLKDRQMLLGEGASHVITLADGSRVLLPNNTNPANRPVISNPGGNAITVASDNVIRGFNIVNTSTTRFGIFGDGTTAPIDNLLVEDVSIQNMLVDAVNVQNATGDITFNRVNINGGTRHGIHLDNVGEANATLNFNNLTITGLVGDGIRVNNFDATTVNVTDVNSSGNAGNGINIIGHRNAAGTGAAFNFIRNTTNGNTGDGTRLEDAQGVQRFLGIVSSNNNGNGLELVDVRNVSVDQATIVDSLTTLAGSVQTTFTGNNGAGIFNNLTVAGATQRFNVSTVISNGNGTGIQTQADGVGTTLQSNIINNTSISANQQHGVVARSNNGATHEFTLTNNGVFGILDLTNNGITGGNGISMFVDDGVTAAPATLVANIANIDLGTQGNNVGIFGATRNQGTLLANINNITVDGASQVFGFDFGNTSNAFISRVRINNVVADGTTGQAMNVNVGANSAVDFTMQNALFNNNPTNQPGAVGLAFQAAGRLRLNLTNNTVNGFDMPTIPPPFGPILGAIRITGTDNAQIVANLVGNTVTDNGPGSDTGNPPNHHGIQIQSSDNATIGLRLVNNVVARNFQQGVFISSADTSTINAALTGNIISGNDLGGPTPGDFGVADLAAITAGNSNMCIAMSTNTFGLPATVNGAGANNILLEVDGVTNGPGNPNAIGNITPTAFGTQCEPAIQTQETQFTTTFGF